MNILRSRGLVALLTAVSVVVPAWGVTAAAATLRVPPGFEVSARRTVAAGVEHVVLARQNPPLVMNVARVSPSASVDLKVVAAFDRVGPRRSAESLEHPTSMCARVDCLVGVNGDFYLPSTEEPYGGVATGGRLLRSPAAGRSQVWTTPSGQLTVGGLTWSGSVTPTRGAALPLAGVNVDVPAGGIVLYTPDYGPSTKARFTELVVRLGGTPRRGQPVGVEVLRMDDGRSDIPADGAILAGDGAGADALRDLWNHRHQAGPIALRVDVDAAESVGIFPVLVRDGRSVAPDSSLDIFAGKHGRSLVGTTADGTLVFVTMDDKRDASAGATIRDAADLLVALGVVEGGNLDGGGGSTLVVEGAVANRPTDGPGSPASEPDGDVLPHEYAPGSFERTAVNLLAVVARGGSSSGGSNSGGSQPDASTPPGSGGSGSGGGGGLFGPVDSGGTGGNRGGGKGGSVDAAFLTALSPLSSTPLASASTLYKVLNLVKSKADKAKADAAAKAADPAAGADGEDEVADSTTTSTRRAKRVAGDGEQAAAPTGPSAGDAGSRKPFVVTAALLILTTAGSLGMLYHSRRRMFPVVVGLRSPAPVVPPRRRTQPPANWW